MKILRTTLAASLAAALLSGSPLILAENVVTIDNNNLTSEAILKGFTGSEDDLPPELMPGEGSGGVKFRGIRMKNSTAAAPSSGCNVPNGTISLQVQFDVNSYGLKRDGYKTLKAMAKAMASPRLNNCKFLIEGHTDASGNADYNRSLSQKRAETVKTFLTYNEIDEGILATTGMGEDSPLDAGNPYAAENRRVQFKIVNGR
ncbi:MAG: OmpA family protein [Gammaproteobacteria bacterium]|nr:OmpA family protein [Gammaproteobacteria bacterium]